MTNEDIDKVEPKNFEKEGLTVDNQFDLLSGLGSVYGKDIKDTLGRDYVLAHFNTDQSTFIEESFENSLDVSKIVGDLKNSKDRFIWNKETKDWERNEDGTFKSFEPTKEEKERIESARIRILKLLRTRPDVISVLNRNKVENFLAKVWGDVKEVDDRGNEIGAQQQDDVLTRIKQRLNEDDRN